MSDRSNGGVKRWMGFKADQVDTESSVEVPTSNNSGALARIRELESQLADLRSRRDITTLSKEEFEILATETAMTLIRTAQRREATATQSAERILTESKRSAQGAIESAEGKARNLLSQAEIRGRRLIDAAENDAKDLLQAAESKAEELLNAKRRESIAITSMARKEAEQMLTSAVADVSVYREWLSSVVAEAERLYKIQVQSLAAASTAIEQSRGRLDAAWERLSQVSAAVERSVDENGKLRLPRKAEGESETPAAGSSAQKKRKKDSVGKSKSKNLKSAKSATSTRSTKAAKARRTKKK